MADISKIKIESGVYDIKDVVAREKIEQLDSPELDVYFLSNGKETFGDCIVCLGEKNIIIDLGYDNKCIPLRNFLSEKNVTKIDAVIISHFHTDHIAQVDGLTYLLNENIDFSNCVFYLPHKNINYNNFKGDEKITIKANETAFCNKLIEKNITYLYPTESQLINLTSNLSLQFFNLKTEYYNDYYDYTKNAYEKDINTTDYNNFSMITKLKHNKNVFMFTGDIEKTAQANNYLVFKECDVLKVEHHSLNYDSNVNYLNQLNPKVAVICNLGYLDLYVYTHNTLYTLKQKGCTIYNTADCGIVEVISKNNKIFSLAEKKTQLYNVNYNLFEGFPIPANSDLNDYSTPGIYYSKDGANTNTLINAPINPKIGAGFKMVVERVSVVEKKLRQYIITSNNPFSHMFFRTTLEGVWQDWKILALSISNTNKLVASDFKYAVTLNDTNNINRSRITNKVCELSLDVTFTEQAPAYTDLLELPFYMYNTENTSFLLATTDNKIFPCYVTHHNNKSYIRCVIAIPANTRLFGYCSYVQPLSLQYPTTS